MKRALMLAGLAFGLYFSTHANAFQGMVIWQNRDCGHFILQLKSGYGLFEWISGPLPNDGDLIGGNLQVPGEHRVLIGTSELPTLIFLKLFSADRAALNAQLPERCLVNKE